MSKLFLVQGVINPNAKSWPKEGYVMHYIIYTPLEKGQKLWGSHHAMKYLPMFGLVNILPLYTHWYVLGYIYMLPS